MLNELHQSAAAAEGYLGPATILAIQGNRVHLETPDAFPWATMAMAQGYEPQEGDQVLAITRGKEWYVIGLIQGTGRSSFTVPGDLEFRAPRGRIDFVSRDGVSLRSRAVELVADTMEFTARSIFERFVDATRWVKDAIHTRAGRTDTVVEGDSHLQAGEIIEQAEGDVRIDGKTIHLA